MLQVLLKAVQCGSNRENVIELLTVATRTNFFRRELPAMLSKFGGAEGDHNTLQFIQDLVDILNQVSQRMPNTFTDSYGLVIIIQKQVEDMLLLIRGKERKWAQALSEKISNMRDGIMKRIMSYDVNDKMLRFERHAPPEDFHNIPILPRRSDIFLSSPVFLRANKKRGKYDNLQHYLDVQFRLYREDCISPLREGIAQFAQEVSAGHNVRRLQDGRLYKNVRLKFEQHTIEGAVYSVLLEDKHCKRINWMKSQRLIYGSLVSLSPDIFNTMHFAMVTESDRKVLHDRHSFKIVFPTDTKIPRNLGTTFTMVESTAYFEAYRHVLTGLQNIGDSELPFQRYIVDCEKDVDPPLYISLGTKLYDLQPVISNDVIFKPKQNRSSLMPIGFRRREYTEKEKTCNINILSTVEEWPSANNLGLDQSQFKAYHAALTQEFVLIQGPPGTGKTYVGLQIAKTLLHNREIWNSTQSVPFGNNFLSGTKTHMLVVCYTNPALDQFMEGIVSFLDPINRSSWKNDIVRVGGRSESKCLEEFLLKNRRHRYRKKHFNENDYFTRLTLLRKNIAVIKETIKNLVQVIPYVQVLANEDSVMLPVHSECFLDGGNLSSEKFFKWLKVDEASLLQRVSKSCKNATKTKNVSQKQLNCKGDQSSELEILRDIEAEEIEAERRIEEEDFTTDAKVIIDLGLAVDQLENDILSPKEVHFDDLFKIFLKQEIHGIYSKLNSTERMSDEEAYYLHLYLWELSLKNRWRLFRYWVDKYREIQFQKLSDLEKEHADVLKKYQKEKFEVDAEVMKESTLIAMTTSAAARYQSTLKDVGARIVVVEEAAEVLEAHIVTALSPKCEHLILIGDHKQLEPKPSVLELAVKYNLSLSMFERMLNNGIENHCLQRQHRMRPEISALVRDIYPVLQDNENVFLYEHVMGVTKDVFFISHNHLEEYGDDLRSYSNKHEAHFIAELCRYLMKQGYKASQITILAAYTGQMFCIRDFMPRQEFDGVRSVAIDKFQGEENDIILLSLVRSNKEGKIGFMKRENRICVALSRAKKGLYIIGNSDLFKSACPRWNNVILKLIEADQLGKALPLYCQNHPDFEGLLVKDATDFSKAPEGGCELKCDFRLECGHACRLYCHPVDKKHSDYKCKRPCPQICLNKHPCTRECHFDKPCNCSVIMRKHLHCGHDANIKCFQPPEEYDCDVIVERELPCGHRKKLECHIDIESYKCLEKVRRNLRCSHEAVMECNKDPDRFKCQTIVTRTLQICGHEAEMKCFVDEQSYKCQVPVTRSLPRCEHEAIMKCGDSSNDYKCQIMGTYSRKRCGHSYEQVCWQHTRSLLFNAYERRHLCETVVSKQFSGCKHTVDLKCHESIELRRCKEIITKVWDCSHTENMECWVSKHKACNNKCLKICEKGHICQELCHYPEKCSCQEDVEKVVPSCSHVQIMKCHQNPEKVKCQEKVMKALPKCGHQKILNCSEDPSSLSVECHKIVQKELLCGHVQNMECSQSPSTYDCRVLVVKTNPKCGHNFRQKCSKEINEFNLPKCLEIVNKTLLCNHEKEIKCSVDICNVRCEVKVHRKLPLCGHLIEMRCFESLEDIKCREKADMVLPDCGHLVQIECFTLQRSRKSVINLPTCHTMVTKQFLCGHTITSECHLANKKSCICNCSCVLSCGHPCKGKCQECSQKLSHKSCRQPCQKVLICGHTCKSSKCGLCGPCLSQCENYCPHVACSHKCFDNCIPCHKKCALQCSHYKCSRLCSEECDRPRCNNRCQELLQCKHPCMGFCGEPCPEFCSLCKPDQIEKFFCRMDENDMFVVKLEGCGHEFDAMYLDNTFDNERDAFTLLRCPQCKKVVRWHPRYANRLKNQWKAIQEVKASLNACTKGANTKVVFPLLVGGVDKIRMYLQKFNTFLYIQEKVHGKADQEICQKWALSFMHHLTQILNSLRYPLEFEYQKGVSLNQNINKLVAVWILLIGKFQNEEKSDVNSDEENGDKSMDELCRKRSQDLQRKAESIIQSVDDFIIKTQTFTSSNLKEVQQRLKPLFTDTLEVEEALSFPALEMGGIHENDWSICSKGHIAPADQTVCCECTTGESWDQRYRSFMKKLQDQPRKKCGYEQFDEIKELSGKNRKLQKPPRGNKQGKGQEGGRDGHVDGNLRKDFEIALTDGFTFEDFSQHGTGRGSYPSKEGDKLKDTLNTERGCSRGRNGRMGRGGTRGRGRKQEETFSVMKTVSPRENTADTESVCVRKVISEKNSGGGRRGKRGSGERTGSNKKQEEHSGQGPHFRKGTKEHAQNITERNSVTPEDKSGGRGGRGRGHRGRGGRGRRGGRGGRYQER